MKIRPVGTELFHAGGRKDIAELTVAFQNFGNAPKKLGVGERGLVGAPIVIACAGW
jgi:hypothetical protein